MTDAAVARASEEEVAVYRELRACYERVVVLARSGRYADATAEAAGSGRVIERLAPVVEAAGAARAARAGRGPDARLEALWADAARSLREILELRAAVTAALDEAAQATRGALARLGRVRAALAGYRGPRAAPPRFGSRRA